MDVATVRARIDGLMEGKRRKNFSRWAIVNRQDIVSVVSNETYRKTVKRD